MSTIDSITLGSDDYLDCHSEFRRHSNQEGAIVSWFRDSGSLEFEGVEAPRLLSVGCGHGKLDIQFIEALRKRHADFRYVGLDPNLSALRDFDRELRARGILSGGRIHFAPLGLENYETEQAYDAVFMVHSLYHFEDRLGALERCLEMVRPGGEVTVIHSTDKGLPAVKEAVYSKVELPFQSPARPGTELREAVERISAVQIRNERIASRVDVTDCLKQTPSGQKMLSFFFMCQFEKLAEGVKACILDVLRGHALPEEDRMYLSHPMQALRLQKTA